jgi:[acyl-carrier-protein] S-malonyltransferase
VTHGILVCGGQGAASLAPAAIPGLAEVVAEHPDLAELARADEIEIAGLPPEVVQPMIVATQLARGRRVIDLYGAMPVLGQSLGEVAGAALAGAITTEDALALASLRAQLPDELLPPSRWRMVAVMDAPFAAIEAACEGRPAWIASANSPVDLIVSGDAVAVVDALDDAAVPVTRRRDLPVVAPYHTPLMVGVQRRVHAHMASIDVRPPRLPLGSATTGGELRTADDVRNALVSSLTDRVLWSSALRHWCAQAGTTVYDCGPSGALARTARRNEVEVRWVMAAECGPTATPITSPA